MLRLVTHLSRRALYPVFVLLAWSAAPAYSEARITSAEYLEPTSRYNHAVLGPDAEWGALRITVQGCAACTGDNSQDILFRLPSERVFEDLAPRLVDLDADGAPEVVTIEAHTNYGARLAVYGTDGVITATPYIGRSYRWLAPIGAADLDGDGKTEIAYIDRPHLAKTLRMWRYDAAQLSEVAVARGLTNHKIGEDFISGGLRDCGTGPELITADSGWTRVIATSFAGGELAHKDIGAFDGPRSLEQALACK